MNNWMSVPDYAERIQTHPERLREVSRREEDPFPIYLFPWCERDGRIPVEDADEWLKRNSKPWGRKYDKK